jgi:hypothetical protein
MNAMLPGLHPCRLLRLMQESIARCKLNLDGLTVLTEAGTSAYVVTPLLAAMAGARQVYAVAKDSRFGSAEDAANNAYELARKCGLERRIQVIDCATPDVIAKADIVTNSGHVRPITAEKIAHMKSTAVVPLMYENWEFRPSDVDLEACRKRGIRVAGTNERHPDIGVFEFLGVMAVKLLLDAGVCVFGSRIVLLCDNAFGPHLEAGLRGAGAHVTTCLRIPDRLGHIDAVLVATTPRNESALTSHEVKRVAHDSPGGVIAQFFGTLDRRVVQENGVPIWPADEPEKGHMGILPSAVGPEPIVRLQTGGLKVGEVLHHNGLRSADSSREFVQPLSG